MKKVLFLVGTVFILSCGREEESKNYSASHSSSESLKRSNSEIGGVEGENIYFKPSNSPCSGGGIPVAAIPGLPYGVNNLSQKVKIASGFENNIPHTELYSVITLSQSLVDYLIMQGITIEQDPIFDNSTPAGSYFSMYSYTELTYTDGKTVSSQPDYFGFPQYSFMNKDKASNVVQDVYYKIINNPDLKRNNIKGIRMFFSQYLCNIDYGPSVDYRIQIIY